MTRIRINDIRTFPTSKCAPLTSNLKFSMVECSLLFLFMSGTIHDKVNISAKTTN